MFKQTPLWRATLAPQSDEQETHREHLRRAYLSMREQAKQLVGLIPVDCKGLTIHDITHLDALWEMAGLICGEDFPLNPCEAFVFGAAVLLHDAGMSVASYPRGLAQLIETIEWRDTAANILKNNGVKASADAIASPPPDLKPEILFQTLRALHARHAEELVGAKWPGHSGNENRLIEDQEIRTAFGASIGRIAQSHHWPIEKLVGGSLIANLGAPSFAPASWTVNEIKIACMLRCADAAHMDRRRAPSLTYALIKPFGVSDTHWRFQNKLNKPTSEHDAIVYATGEPFELNEARAWWLCYDTLVMLDNELRKSNSVLIANGLHQFAIKQVAGVSDPQTLSRYIRVNGWKPVDAEIRVTNPIHLAKTLGGKNLYGNDFIAPVRELLQNAVDAVRARRLVSKRGSTWGSIRVRIERQGEETWLHIDDTGIGMSEATLTGALLDFGNSFWRTQAFRDEWPGLESSGLETIGKFGIGFFSIFLLGEHIKVVSRRYDAGKLDARLLEFESIGLRPLVRSPAESEMHEDYVTTVSVKIDEQKIRDEDEFSFRPSNLPAKTTNLSEWLLKRVRHIMRLVSGVDVEILLETPSNNLLHAPNWTTIAPETFLTEVVPQNLGASFLAAYAPRLRILRDDNGVIYGRAALSVSGRPSYRIISPLSGISVGGFFVARGPEGLVGLLTGDTIDASRHSAKEKVPAEVLANWATEQAQLVTEDYFSLGERLYAAERVDMLGGDPKDLPFVFCGGDLVTRSQFVEIALREGEIHFLLDARYEDRLYWVNISNINIGMLSDNMLPNICAFGWKERDTSDTVFGNDKVNEQYLGDAPVEIALDLIDLGRSGTTVFELLERTWGGTVQATLQQLQIFASTHHFLPPERWVLSVKLENN